MTTKGHTITITPGDIHVEVRVDGEKVAESDDAVQLDETGLPTRYYLRREDVGAALRSTSFTTECPFKGRASYWSLEVAGKVHDGIAWSYEEPKPGAEGITGLLSFFPDRAEVSVEG